MLSLSMHADKTRDFVLCSMQTAIKSLAENNERKRLFFINERSFLSWHEIELSNDSLHAFFIFKSPKIVVKQK